MLGLTVCLSNHFACQTLNYLSYISFNSNIATTLRIVSCEIRICFSFCSKISLIRSKYYTRKWVLNLLLLTSIIFINIAFNAESIIYDYAEGTQHALPWLSVKYANGSLSLSSRNFLYVIDNDDVKNVVSKRLTEQTLGMVNL